MGVIMVIVAGWMLGAGAGLIIASLVFSAMNRAIKRKRKSPR